jgi:hypothetical protein
MSLRQSDKEIVDNDNRTGDNHLPMPLILMLANYKEERDPLSDYLEKSLFLVLTSPT